jgi:hypothetical protein
MSNRYQKAVENAPLLTAIADVGPLPEQEISTKCSSKNTPRAGNQCP